jgi:hypothetical protein
MDRFHLVENPFFLKASQFSFNPELMHQDLGARSVSNRSVNSIRFVLAACLTSAVKLWVRSLIKALISAPDEGAKSRAVAAPMIPPITAPITNPKTRLIETS